MYEIQRVRQIGAHCTGLASQQLFEEDQDTVGPAGHIVLQFFAEHKDRDGGQYADGKNIHLKTNTDK